MIIKREYNYSKLLGKIKEVLGCNSNLALKLKISERTMSLKLTSKVDFKQEEIMLICEILNISYLDIGTYFFEEKTQRN